MSGSDAEALSEEQLSQLRQKYDTNNESWPEKMLMTH